MKKQKKQTVLTGIIVILVIILIVMIGSIVYEEIINKQNIQDTIVSEVNKEENIIQEDEELPTEKEVEDKTTEKDEYVGEEEKEAENESETVEQEKTESNDEKAIKLAQKEWGDDETVTFSVEKKKDTKYYVAVKSAATVLQWYEVDTETWEISEY